MLSCYNSGQFSAYVFQLHKERLWEARSNFEDRGETAGDKANEGRIRGHYKEGIEEELND